MCLFKQGVLFNKMSLGAKPDGEIALRTRWNSKRLVHDKFSCSKCDYHASILRPWLDANASHQLLSKH